MAKKKVLSLEEKLEEALIPKEDHPYEIPNNWEWVKLETFKENINYSFVDGPFGSNLKATEYQDKGVRLIQLQNIKECYWKDDNKKFISKEKAETLFKHKAYPGDIAIAKMASPIARATILPDFEEYYVIVADCVKLSVNKKMNAKFIELAINSPEMRSEAEKYSKGSTRKRINLGDLRKLKTPLPPKSEQERIVKKLEDMLSKTKQAKELIFEAKETFELRRASILHQAFTGELTKKWREENPIENGKLSVDSLLKKINVEKVAKWEEECKKAIEEGKRKPKKPVIKPVDEMKVPSEEQPYELPEGWGWVRLGEVSDSIVPNRDKPKSFTGKIPWLTMSDLDTYKNKNYFNESSLFLSIEEIEKYKCRVIPKGSVIMSCIGNFGISIVNDQDVSSNQQLHAFLLGNNVSSKYISYLIKNSKIYYENLSTSTTIKYINKSKCESLPTPLPPLTEQKEIVKKIEKMLEAEEKAKELLDMESQIELLEKSILSKAFRGELGTNDPNDEPAMELLRRVLVEETTSQVTNKIKNTEKREKKVKKEKAILEIIEENKKIEINELIKLSTKSILEVQKELQTLSKEGKIKISKKDYKTLLEVQSENN